MKREAIAIKPISNLWAIAIYDIEYGIEDRVLAAHINGDHACKPYRSKIRYDKQGEPYFMKYGHKEYLSEYIKTEV